MNIILSIVEARVVACLIEKEATTPDNYPMTLSALIAACNQKSNRDPVMALDEQAVSDALNELRYRDRIAWQVSLAGSRVPKYKHDIQSRIPLESVELAVICELMLRGPQTVGELRSRTQRFGVTPSAEDIADALRSLGDRETGGLVIRLSPGPGRREPRYAHLLCGPVEEAAEVSASETTEAVPTPSPTQQRIADLESTVTSLSREVDQLHKAFDLFRQQFE